MVSVCSSQSYIFSADCRISLLGNKFLYCQEQAASGETGKEEDTGTDQTKDKVYVEPLA